MHAMSEEARVRGVVLVRLWRVDGLGPGTSVGRLRARLVVAVLGCALWLPCAALGASSPKATATLDGWPGFRGPNRDGVSRAAGLADAWPEDGPRVVWRVAGGAGFSGIAIDSGRAFTLWQESDAQRLVALDAGSGEILWSHTLGPPYYSSYGDGPRATPVVDGGLVFAIDAHGRLSAVRADDGVEVWSHDLQKELGARIPAIGYASTPLVEGDRLLVEVGAAAAAFVAFDKRTGEPVWRSQSDEPAYVSPVALTAAGRRQVVFYSASGLYGLAPESGELLWHHPWPAPCPATGIPLNAASPVFVPPDRLFVSKAWGDDKGGALLRLAEGADGLAVETLWHEPLIDSEINTAVLLDDRLYGFKGEIFVSLDAATGEMGWSQRGFGRGSLIGADGKLIVLGEGGNLALVAADSSEYRELGTAQVLNGRSWTAPALADGRLFVRDEKEIVSVDLSDPRSAATHGPSSR